jgi:hypothetical protein
MGRHRKIVDDDPETGIETEPGPDKEQTILKDLDFESRIQDFLIQDQAENVPCHATLYKLVRDGLGREMPQQIDSYISTIPPSRHEIGSLYGSGKYMIVLSRGTGKEQVSTSRRFVLHTSYDDLKRKREQEAAVLPVACSPSIPSTVMASNAAKEAFAMVQQMMGMVIQLIKPVLDRAVAPAPQPQGRVADQFGILSSVRDVIKNQAKQDVKFFDSVRRGILNMNAEDIETVEEPKEKKSIAEHIISIIEPFLPLLGNSLTAKATAASLSAIPQVKQAIAEIQGQPDVAADIVNYVIKKEGPKKAAAVLQRFGLDPAKYIQQNETKDEEKSK